jgi:hypothetical protein
MKQGARERGTKGPAFPLTIPRSLIPVSLYQGLASAKPQTARPFIKNQIRGEAALKHRRVRNRSRPAPLTRAKVNTSRLTVPYLRLASALA